MISEVEKEEKIIKMLLVYKKIHIIRMKKIYYKYKIANYKE